MDHHQYITNESERKSGKHLTSEDRGAIQAMKKLGYSNRKIAAYLHCSPTTISNELKRGTPPKKKGRGRKAGYSYSAKSPYHCPQLPRRTGPQHTQRRHQQAWCWRHRA